jgi:acid phosphatase (class A)
MAMSLRLFAILFLLFTGSTATHADALYISHQQVDLAKLLAPPPQAQSDRQKQDLMDVLDAQRRRTPEQSEHALADDDLSVFRIAGEVLGSKFTAERLPKTSAFFNHLMGDVRTIFLATKDVWNRPRPFAVSADVKAIGERPKSGSYPSGHGIRGYLTAIIMANILPEKSAELFARGRDYGMSRVVAGVHFPSDIEAGRLAATALAVGLMQSPAFTKDLMEVKAELRGELGLTTQQ